MSKEPLNLKQFRITPPKDYEEIIYDHEPKTNTFWIKWKYPIMAACSGAIAATLVELFS